MPEPPENPRGAVLNEEQRADGPQVPTGAGSQIRRSSMLAFGWLVLVCGAIACVTLWTGSARSSLTQFLLAMAAIVLASNLLGSLVARLGQPAVVGEILGGLLLGSSGLGLLWPQARAWLFPSTTVATLNLVAQLGLVTFMFLLGCEMRLSVGRDRGSGIAAVTAASMGLPFIAGVLLAVPGRDVLAGGSADTAAYLTFVGLALSITALPVLARILTDLGLRETRVGTLALSCAAAGDGIAWGGLTVVLAVAGGRGLAGLSIVLPAGVLALVTVMLVRPGLRRLANRAERVPQAGHLMLPVLVGGALGYAAATEYIGLHPVIGAFVFGVVVPRSPLVSTVGRQLEGFAIAVLLPVFFASVGLNLVVTEFGVAPLDWLVFASLLVAAVGTKFVASLLGGWVANVRGRDALLLAALMNCRGVTEIVVATVGLQTGLISPVGFTMFVILALVSTIITGPLVRVWGRTNSAASVPGRPPRR